MFKSGAFAHIETTDTMVMFKPEQKEAYRNKVIDKATSTKWAKAGDMADGKGPFAHHLFFQLEKEEAVEESEPSTRVDSDDDMFKLD
jgi:hypothetical protein